MNFYDKITGHDMTKQQQAFQSRIERLPVDYQTTWQELNETIWNFTDFSGRNLYPILEGVLELFEESNAEDLPVDAITGGNVTAFINEVAQAQGAQNYRDKQRDKLNRAIANKLGK